MTAEDAMLVAVRGWKDFHNREGKRLTRPLRPAVPRNVVPLRHIGGYRHPEWATPDPSGLVSAMKAIINDDRFAQASTGWDLALRNADPRYLWETLILDVNAEFAPLWSDAERLIVVNAIADSYRRFATDEMGPARA